MKGSEQGFFNNPKGSPNDFVPAYVRIEIRDGRYLTSKGENAMRFVTTDLLQGSKWWFRPGSIQNGLFLRLVDALCRMVEQEIVDFGSHRRVKPLLYVYRVLLTGIHLMRTGQVEANLLTLNQAAGLSFLSDLVARKLAGLEYATLKDVDIGFPEAQYQQLRPQPQAAFEASALPETPSEKTRRVLNDLLVRGRIKGLTQRAG